MRSVYNSKFNLVGLIILCKSGLVPRRKEISIRKPLKFIKYLIHLHDGPKWNPNQSEGPINCSATKVTRTILIFNCGHSP